MSPRKRQCPYRSEIERLLAIFADVLSDRQRECLQRHYVRGQSLSQIGRDLNISRQAVLDAVLHGEQRLLVLGECLKRAGLFPAPSDEGGHAPTDSIVQALISLRDRLAHEGVIYSPRWIIEELEGILSALGHAARRG
jgi:GAF domain-containing protein